MVSEGQADKRAKDIDVHVGKRLRRLREVKKMTQGKLGRHLGLTFSQVQKYEKGDNRIGAGRLHIIAGALGVPVEYFYEGLDGSAKVEYMRLTQAENEMFENLRGCSLDVRAAIAALITVCATGRRG